MKNLDRMPGPREIMDSPELAVLVALETTLVAALRALLAVHTDLLEDRFPRTITPSGFWAERLIYLGGHMTTAIAKYRAAIDDKAVPTADAF
jgi:hypothetical protein